MPPCCHGAARVGVRCVASSTDVERHQRGVSAALHAEVAQSKLAVLALVAPTGIEPALQA